MANKMNLQKAMTEYAEEKAWIAAEQKLATMPESDPLWDTWYDESYYYEPAGKVDIEIKKDTTVTTKSNNKPQLSNNRFKRANRRRQTFYHKVKIQRNAEAILNGYCKRSEEDQRNGAFCKKRGGRRVTWPKSLTMKSEAILKRAEKMKLVADEPAVENTTITVNTDVAQSKAA